MRNTLLGLALITLGCATFAANPMNIMVKPLGETHSGSPLPSEIPAKFNLPPGQNLTAIVIVHGSAGPDSRGTFHREYLVENGFAVLELDMWSPRAVTSLARRPRSTLDTLPDVWGAWHFLANNPNINKDKIVIMGFSWGGVNAMATAFGKKSKNPPIELSNAKFAAHIAFYPVCDVWVKNGIASRSVDLSTPTGAPVQIHNGTRDDYDTAPNICESLKTAHPLMPIELLMYEDATHGFDSANAQAVQFYDPVAKNGKGGQVKVIGDEQARSRAKASVLDFLRRSLPRN